uniref:Uncharacterized protein n=1 Tax=Octopus bimaculoides TaxID=37653 RepID=A0A0L8G192_OCTBM
MVIIIIITTTIVFPFFFSSSMRIRVNEYFAFFKFGIKPQIHRMGTYLFD